jgi:hypothetical protein
MLESNLKMELNFRISPMKHPIFRVLGGEFLSLLISLQNRLSCRKKTGLTVYSGWFVSLLLPVRDAKPDAFGLYLKDGQPECASGKRQIFGS